MSSLNWNKTDLELWSQTPIHNLSEQHRKNVMISGWNIYRTTQVRETVILVH